MKSYINKLFCLTLALFFVFFISCDNSHDEWLDGDPSLQHVYYYCFDKWGSIPGGNDVTYTVKHNERISIPTRFYSNYTRSYSPEVCYYTAVISGEEALVCGIDYDVVDDKGNVLIPDENGAYPMVWPNAKGGVQNIYIKALSTKKGSFRVLTFPPDRHMDVTDVNTTSIIKTNEYEVRGISENYFVTVTIIE